MFIQWMCHILQRVEKQRCSRRVKEVRVPVSVRLRDRLVFGNGQRDKTWVLEANGEKLLQELYKEGEFVRGLFFKNGERIPLPSSELKPVIFTPTNIGVTEGLIFDSRETFDAYPFINTSGVQ